MSAYGLSGLTIPTIDFAASKATAPPTEPSISRHNHFFFGITARSAATLALERAVEALRVSNPLTPFIKNCAVLRGVKSIFPPLISGVPPTNISIASFRIRVSILFAHSASSVPTERSIAVFMGENISSIFFSIAWCGERSISLPYSSTPPKRGS